MFKDKEYIDPFQVLDLSYLDVSTLPEKYKKKYYFDFQEKNGFLSNIDDKNTFYLE
ncbi:MAG: hypothetical protein P1U46_04330 [Patescibacteria group bacterium]|nr:hypothetical protein [Patescibacteria group bacterium]